MAARASDRGAPPSLTASAARSLSPDMPAAPPGATALLLIDVQPEWFSGSGIEHLFPHLRRNIGALLALCRASPGC